MERLTEVNARWGSRSCGWTCHGERTHTHLINRQDDTVPGRVIQTLTVRGLGARGFVMQQARLSMEAGNEKNEATKVGAKIEPADLVGEALRGMGRAQIVTNKPLTQQAHS